MNYYVAEKKIAYLRIVFLQCFGKMFIDYINPYSWVVTLRNVAFDKGWLESKSFTLPIISVGNLTVGGTGKTPHIEYIIELLKNEFEIATLSRG